MPQILGIILKMLATIVTVCLEFGQGNVFKN
jgi:hypothetical protein